MKDRQVSSALAWAKVKCQELDNISSDLLFNLHKTEFSILLNQLA